MSRPAISWVTRAVAIARDIYTTRVSQVACRKRLEQSRHFPLRRALLGSFRLSRSSATDIADCPTGIGVQVARQIVESVAEGRLLRVAQGARQVVGGAAGGRDRSGEAVVIGVGVGRVAAAERDDAQPVVAGAAIERYLATGLPKVLAPIRPRLVPK